MNPEQQRIAIAEACGWTTLPMPAGCPDAWEHKDTGDTAINEMYLPDYLNDLNAMHKAEQKLIDDGLQDVWLDELVGVVVNKNVHWSDYHCFPQVNRATAAQRAEAFLRTVGEWAD